MGRTGGAGRGHPDAGLEAALPDIAFLPGAYLVLFILESKQFGLQELREKGAGSLRGGQVSGESRD